MGKWAIATSVNGNNWANSCKNRFSFGHFRAQQPNDTRIRGSGVSKSLKENQGNECRDVGHFTNKWQT